VCGQVGSCHGDDKVQKCPKKKSGALQQFFWLDGKANVQRTLRYSTER
jgi:hypothetical protein